jgi:PglZ domain
MKGGMVTLEQSIHRVAYKVDFAKFAPAVFRWHYGFADTATLREAHPAADRLSDRWVAVGLRIDPQADNERRLAGLIEATEESIPDVQAEHRRWLVFVRRWAELQALRYEVESPELEPRFLSLRERVDSSFLSWVSRRYSGLHNLPSVSPAMLHHVPRALLRDLENGDAERVALVVVDGLAFDQWVVLRNMLGNQMSKVGFYDEAAFAWIPAITPVSRQALFAGKPPVFFPTSIGTTSKERSLWHQFWADSLGLTDVEVDYVNIQGNEDVGGIEDIIRHPKLRVVGIVVRMVDMIMHGMKLGTRGMHDQVLMWAEQGHLARLLGFLLEQDFRVYLTSDHGNIEAKGCGRPSEGSVAEVRGERVRVYSDPLLRAETAERFLGAIEWPASGLPGDYLPLLAPNRTAFVREGERIVGHGGISIEELVVPFVRIREGT